MTDNTIASRRQTQPSPLRPVEFLTLATLMDSPRHGYAMVQEIARQTGGRVQLRPGDLYRVLARMERRGLLEVSDRRPAPEIDDQRRTYYMLTGEGQRVVQEEAQVLSKVSQAVLAHRQEEVSL